MCRARLAAILLTLGLGTFPALAFSADVAVVCPAQFREALEPWLRHRASQGHEFAFVSPSSDALRTASGIRQAAKRNDLKFVLVVGDADQTATAPCEAKIICKICDDKDIASDNCYGDLDEDGLPDLAVGRLSADSPEELGLMIDKIVKYEQELSRGDWQRRINLIAGVGGFGLLADTAIEVAARKFIVEGVPAEYCISMTQASWRSPYFPDPRDFRRTTIDRLSDGCLFWVYIGHGQRRRLDSVSTPDGVFHPILTSADAPHVRARHGAPIAVFMACYTGAFDEPEDCLAEELLRQPEGPVAVLASSRASMPYAMGVMATKMMQACFVDRRETIGEILVQAKRELVLGRRDDETSKSLDVMAAAISLNADLAAEREEHVRLFNLLGDPLLRVAHPLPIELRVDREARKSGDELRVTGRCDVEGEVTIELALRRDRLTFRRPYRENFDASDEGQRALQGVYEQANDQRVAVVTTRTQGGRFTAVLRIPPEVFGECHVRATVVGDKNFASGAQAIKIR